MPSLPAGLSMFKGVNLLTYLLSFILVCCLWEMPLLVGNGVACFSCMHTIRAEAGLCLLVPAMFDSVMVFIICLAFFGVYRDQKKHWRRGEAHVSLSLRNLIPTPILSHTLHLQVFLTWGPYLQLRIYRRELQFSKQSRLLTPPPF